MTNRQYTDRELYGPEFDDRLIKLVRANPAIYDTKHPHYRRNPVRIQIWNTISKKLEVPSRFLQTKWKNIRYNYLQELKSLETGRPNPNIRRRRFTEDLSFLRKAVVVNDEKVVQRTNNISDAESNSCEGQDISYRANSFEVIELDQSDGEDFVENSPQCLARISGNRFNSTDLYENPDQSETAASIQTHELEQNVNIPPPQFPTMSPSKDKTNLIQLSHSGNSNHSSPVVGPVISSYGSDMNYVNGNGITSEEDSVHGKRYSEQIVSNAAKRRALQTALPTLTPINDPIELYCLSLVDSLRAMPRSERERVKYEFANILKDAKYKDDA